MKNKFYKDLEIFVDTYEYRLSGSAMYEKSVDDMKTEMIRMGLTNPHEEFVSIPNWYRDEEEAIMLRPRNPTIPIIGLSQSIPTPPEGIRAEVILIPTYQFIESHPQDVAGKIVLFDLKGLSKRDFRLKASRLAYEAKAVAVLGRSLVSKTLYSVSARTHIQTQYPIPIACITNEDADLMSRLAERGIQITMHLKLLSNISNSVSRNLVGDYNGRADGKPSEIILLNGHMDSFDVSQGAQDNGCGVILATTVTKVLQHLGLRPRRTLRLLLTVGNEYNYLGSRAYITSHLGEMRNQAGVLIADAGCGRPMGYIFHDNYPKLGCLLMEVSLLFENTLTLLQTNESFTSGDAYAEANLPVILMNGDDGRYYWVRHTYADTMSHVEARHLDEILAFWATTTFVLSDIIERLGDF